MVVWFGTMSNVVAIQGVLASFHHIAAQEFFGDDFQVLPSETFTDAFRAVASGKADNAVIAIENSLYGSINEVYDLLLKYKFCISGEVYLRIEQCLIGLPQSSPQAIKEVYSHPVALAQCEYFLDTKLPAAKRFEHHDTAGAAADIKAWGDASKAAIASRQAAKFYGMAVLAKGIETHKANYTRFIILQKEKSVDLGADKTSLILETADRPGALYYALGVFAKAGINLTKLQSRPIIGRAWHYMFYVDVQSNASQEPLLSALQELKKQDCAVTVLGSYKSAIMRS